MRVTSNDVELHVEVHGDGDPVLLLHGWPDDAGLWRNQVPATFSGAAVPVGKASLPMTASTSDS